MRFWKSYICSDMLDVQETNFSFAQFNRIRHLFFDAGLRLDGISALDLWDLIVVVLGNTNQSHKEQGDLSPNQRDVRSTPHIIQKRKQSQRMINDLDNVDFVSSTRILFIRKLCCISVKTTKQ